MQYMSRHLLGTDFNYDGHKVPIDKDMTDAVKVYLKWCLQVEQNGFANSYEQRVKLDQLWGDNPPEHIFGTADLLALDLSGRKMIVGDYKHGAGVKVEVQGNPQLLAYGLGSLYEIGPDAVDEVTIYVIQPRAQTGAAISWETFSTVDLLMWGEMELKPGVERMLEQSPPLKSGDWCKFCPARVSCPVLKKMALDTAKTEFGEIPPEPSHMDDQELSQILMKAELIKSWLNACQAEASARIDRGGHVPGWKLVDKRAQRKWGGNENHVISTLAEKGVVPQAYLDTKLKSPTQIEKTDEKIYRAVEEFVVKESSGTTLVPDNDKREPASVGPGNEFDVIEDGTDGKLQTPES